MKKLAFAMVVVGVSFCAFGQAAKSPVKKVALDTIIVEARLTEIPGTFAPNDLYNYVYIMKYRIVKVVKGTCTQKDILVGQYNPLIPRARIKDKMDAHVDGNVEKMEIGAMHRLVLISPIDKVWKDAIEDEYFDDEQTKYYALRTDLVK
jgi:hypothetical protein